MIAFGLFDKENCFPEEIPLTDEQKIEIERLKEGINYLKKYKKKVNNLQKKLAVMKFKNIQFDKKKIDPLQKRLDFLFEKFKIFELPESFSSEYFEYREFYKKNFEVLSDQIFLNEFKFMTSKLTRAMFRTSQNILQKIKDVKSTTPLVEKSDNKN